MVAEKRILRARNVVKKKYKLSSGEMRENKDYYLYTFLLYYSKLETIFRLHLQAFYKKIYFFVKNTSLFSNKCLLWYLLA